MHAASEFAGNRRYPVNPKAIRGSDGAMQVLVEVAVDPAAQTVLVESLRRQVSQLEGRVAETTQRLEATVEELRRKNEEIADHSSVISIQKREREVILREVYHRVKNNLQVVESMLKMKFRSLTDSAAREALETSILRVHAMAMVHERIYQAPDLGCVSLMAYLGGLIGEVMTAHSQNPEQVKFELDVDEISLPLDAAIPFGLLMNELLSNCLEHGIPKGGAGNIHVSVRRAVNCVHVVVEDNGRGLPEGFDQARSASLGLKLAASWARQLGGTLQITSSRGCLAQADLTRLAERVPAERTCFGQKLTAGRPQRPPTQHQGL